MIALGFFNDHCLFRMDGINETEKNMLVNFLIIKFRYSE